MHFRVPLKVHVDRHMEPLHFELHLIKKLHKLAPRKDIGYPPDMSLPITRVPAKITSLCSQY